MSNNPIKVALVEDDVALVQMYLSKLEHEGFNVKHAGNGLDGLELIKTFQPDVVLLDIMMPDSNGIDLLQHVYQVYPNDKLKIIIMTNLDDPKLRKSLEQMGASAYLIKAEVTPTEIVEKIRSLV
jgi:DNA-binding response OmpR family regulator